MSTERTRNLRFTNSNHGTDEEEMGWLYNPFNVNNLLDNTYIYSYNIYSYIYLSYLFNETHSHITTVSDFMNNLFYHLLF